MEPHTSRLQIYGSFSSSSSSVPISVIDENGNVLNSTINVYPMGDKNYFIAEIFLNKDSDGRFESLNDWHSNHTTLTLDTRYKNEGVRSLVTSAGWKVIESRDVSTADFVMLGDRMDIDIFVPSTSQNQYWIGLIIGKPVLLKSLKKLNLFFLNHIQMREFKLY